MSPDAAHPPHRTEDSVTVHSMGGLGNQLFIYAAGLAAAQAADARLRVDVGQHAVRPDRPPQLAELGLQAEYVDLGTGQVASALRRRVSRWVPLAGDVPHACTYRESGFRFDPAALRQPQGSCMFGYFQSWRYLEPVAEGLREQLGKVGDDRLAGIPHLVGEVSAESSITLHVRRGDYLHVSAKDYHGVADAGYYRQAVSTLRRMGFDGPLRVFSDDLPAAQAELAGLGDLQGFATAGLDAVDEMFLMSRSSALVTANSSFSWWAGWLGDRPERPVIAPRPWFDDPAVDSRDLLPPHWLTLDRRAA